MENKTTVESYRSKNVQTKEVTLPSGEVFEIKKITTRDYIQNGGLQLSSASEIAGSSEEKNKILWDKMNDGQKKQQLEATSKMIILAVINPPISYVKMDGKLCIEEITDEDYYFLLKEITSFSFGRQDLKPFRQEPDTVNSGFDSEAIPQTPVGTDEHKN